MEVEHVMGRDTETSALEAESAGFLRNDPKHEPSIAS